jgi:hypothetical protein
MLFMGIIKERYLTKFNYDEDLQDLIVSGFQELKENQHKKEYECFVFDEISSEVKALAIHNFPVKEIENLLFFRIKIDEAYTSSFWTGSKLKITNLSDCYLLTDTGFYYKKDDNIINERWENIDKFYYKHFTEYVEVAPIPVRINLGWFSDNEYKKCNKLLNAITKYYKDIFFVHRMLIESGDYQLALKDINEKLKSNIDLPVLHFDKGVALMAYIERGKKKKLGGLYSVSLKPNEIESLLNEAEQELDFLLYSSKEDIKEEYPMIYYQKSQIARYRKNTLIQRKFLIKAMSTNDYTLQTKIQTDMMEAENNVKDVYTDINYDERKIITFVKKLNKDCSTNAIEVFRIDNRPAQIRFPKGHPIVGELYIGHPYRKDLYIPYANHDFAFFLDEINEYCELLQALGSTEITIEVIKGKNIAELQNYSFDVSGGANYGPAFKANGEYNEKKEFQKKSSLDNYLKEHQKMEPMTLPYVPENLIWYPEKPRWQRLSNQRTNNNNLLEFEEEFSSKETSFVSESELESIKADLQILKLGANISMNENILKQVERTEETIWKINIKFKSISDFALSKSGNYHNMLNQKEDEYRTKVLNCLDGSICLSDIDKRYLERKRINLGISEERAREIENSCLPQLSKEEREYIEICKEFSDIELNDPHTLKILDKERIDLGISVERANELKRFYAHGE